MPFEVPTVNVPASILGNRPVVTNPPKAYYDIEHDDEFYEQLQRALTLSY